MQQLASDSSDSDEDEEVDEDGNGSGAAGGEGSDEGEGSGVGWETCWTTFIPTLSAAAEQDGRRQSSSATRN